MSSQTITMEHAGAAVIGTPRHFRWLQGIVKWIIPLNLLDAIFTLVWIQTGRAVEANTFLRDLAHGDALLFMLAKLSLVSLGVIFLWKNRHRPLAVVAIFAGFLAYYVVLLHHLRYVSSHLF